MIKNKKQKSGISFNLLGGANVCRLFAAALLFTCFAAVCAVQAAAQTASVTKNFVAYPTTVPDNFFHCQTGPDATTYYPTGGMPVAADDRSFYIQGDPWKQSALIEFDQPHNWATGALPTTPGNLGYPNHCLTLCGQVTCSNPVRKVAPPDNSSNSVTTMYEGSGPFPIQQVLFEIFKYQKNVNPYNPDTSPPIRTIPLYPSSGINDQTFTCRGVGSWKIMGGISTIFGGTDCSIFDAGQICASGSCCDCCDFSDAPTGTSCPSTSGVTASCAATCSGVNGGFTNYAECSAGLTQLNFCAPWDASYEIDGEFGKSNGQFGFRTAISTTWPGDGVSTPDINIESMAAYPGELQIPIQVDVTNIHSVRSTPTMVGSRVIVPTQPYKIAYRISKDARVRIQIMDTVGTTGSVGPGTLSPIVWRNLITWEPRLGEGTPGGTSAIDTVTTEVEGWDGRDDQGRLLPMGNYMVSVQAFSQDEWSGYLDPFETFPDPLNPVRGNVDLSRTVTRQLSLDPLKITDIVETGLSKTSTAYAMLQYMLTEAATVHVEIYTPGTSFNNTANPAITLDVMNNAALSNADIRTTIAGYVQGGYKLAEYLEHKAERSSVNTKWDGRCWFQGAGAAGTGTGCAGAGYSVGSMLPDGNYVYLIWAEIPYSLPYAPGTDSVTVNGKAWDGVKTRMLHNGFLPINRGLPDITIQPVGYGTIGSSPTAFGLDPFTFRFSISRDSIVEARILTTSDSNGANVGPYVVKTLLHNQTKMANQMNVETWDGRDDNGRLVSSGNYIFEVAVKDALFPDKLVTATVIFPVDMFRVVDVTTVPIIGGATSQAYINYILSRSMDVSVKIYKRDVIIPAPGASNRRCPEPCGRVGLGGWTPLTPGTTTQINCIHRLSPNATAYASAGGAADVIKSFEGIRPGEGVMITEAWDGFDYDANNAAVVQDGLYPYLICAKSPAPGAEYYETLAANGTSLAVPIPLNGKDPANYLEEMYATDKPVGNITVARGPVYFLNLQVRPSQPQLFFSTINVQLPTYEVSFATTRTARVKIEVISTEDGMCTGAGGATARGTVCRVLTQFTPNSDTSIYDPLIINKVYWDGKDVIGNYVKKSAYEFRFTATPYPDMIPVEETIQSLIITVNNFQVFDTFIWDVSQQNNRTGRFAYQISVPMKVAIQIFKPGTRIDYNNDNGWLIDPVDGGIITENTNSINKVLVKAIIGVRPHLVSIEDIWDGTDFAGQKVPDGIYPFRFVTVTDAYNMDSITGSVRPTQAFSTIDFARYVVADWDKYTNLNIINVVPGDSWFADVDWKSDKVTMFFPNPLRKAVGEFEITTAPAPGTVNIKIFNIAGDLVRDGGYECYTARGDSRTLEQWNLAGGISPDMGYSSNFGAQHPGVRNFALRCKWDKTNQNGKPVARGLYYAIMELNPTRGNAPKSQKVIKILIP